MNQKMIKALKKGELRIGDISINCAVLEDGTRVISESGINKHLGTPGGKSYKLRERTSSLASAGPLPLFLSSKALEPFIDKVFGDMDLVPIIYTDGDSDFIGYSAEVLPKVCEVWLMAREADALQVSQLPKAQRAEILIRSLAKVGITALVDEATGYQYDRERFELQKILDSYISEEVAKWQLTFTIEFYKHLFRLWGVPFTEKFIKKKPQFVGKLTVKYVYDQLPDPVIEKIKDINPKSQVGNYKYRWHQLLTDDVGREHLKKQINEVVALMAISDSKEDFIKNFNKRYNQHYQLEFDFKNDIKDFTELSSFNKNLKKALEYKGH